MAKRAWWKEALTYLAPLLGAVALLGVLYGWRVCVVDPWAARTEKFNYGPPGQFGDSYGPVTATFSALAFLLAMLTFNMQRRAQRDADKNAADQARAFTEAIEHMAGQRDAVLAQVEQQVHANTIAALANSLEATKQILEIDRVAATAIDDWRRINTSGNARAPLNTNGHHIWELLYAAEYQNKLDSESWHGVVLTDELRKLLVSRRHALQVLDLVRATAQGVAQRRSKVPPVS